MTVQQLIDQLNEKVRTGEFLPSMDITFNFRIVSTLPFAYRDGNVRMTLKYADTDEEDYDLEEENETNYKPVWPGDK